MKNFKYQKGLNIDDLPEIVSEVIAGIGNLDLMDATVFLDEGEYMIESDNGIMIAFTDGYRYAYFEYNGIFGKGLNLRSESDIPNIIRFAKEYIAAIQSLENLTK